MVNGIPEFLVTMKVVGEDTEDFVLCDSHNVERAIMYAFSTRNIASSWEITNIESDDVEFSLTLPVTFETYNNICDSHRALQSLVTGG